ncbi:MAG: FRG domain-containing protein [Treponema sp.]|nr:FRG domain-containing protein [Spirochaetales bacterium]MDY5812278.1 FRG domain-containing protein [Treponema sp.]
MKIEVQGYFYIPSSTIQVVGKIEDLIKEIPSTISIKLDKDNYPKTYEEVCKLEKNINPDCNEKILEIKKLIEIIILSKDQKIEPFRQNVLDKLKEINKNDDIIMSNKLFIIYDSSKVKFKEIEKLKDFTESISDIFKPTESNRIRHIYFRGQQNINWGLLPNIFRKSNWLKNEKNFVYEMLLNMPEEFEHCKSTIEKLAKMQHFRCPTRLLDVTRNAYIALFFACEKDGSENDDAIGEVVFFESNSQNDVYFDNDAVSCISNLALAEKEIFPTQDKDAKAKELDSYIKKETGAESDTDFNKKKEDFLKNIRKFLFVHTKNDTQRIINQQGLFILFGMKEELSDPADIQDSFYRDEKDNKKLVFVIKSGNKNKILEELNLMNINEKFIYPDLDHVSKYLKEVLFK